MCARVQNNACVRFSLQTLKGNIVDFKTICMSISCQIEFCSNMALVIVHSISIEKRRHIMSEKTGIIGAEIDTTASVRLSAQGERFAIDCIALTMQAAVQGIDDVQFQKIATAAKRDCPLSKALSGVAEITLTAVLK
jgi:uncharacterized OsmC-like protein